MRRLSFRSAGPAPAFVLLGLYWGGFAVYVPAFKARIGAGDAHFGLLLLGAALGVGAAMLVAPLLERRLGRPALALGALAMAALFFGPGLAPGAIGFFLAMAAAGLASGITDILMNTRVAALEAADGRPRMNGHHALFSLAYAIAALAAGAAREAGLGHWVLVAATGAGALMIAPGLARAGADAPGRAPPEPTALSSGLAILLPGLIVFCAFAAEAAVEAWSALFIERVLEGRALEGARGPALLGLTMAAGRAGGQALARRFGERRLVVAAACLAAAGGVLVSVSGRPAEAQAGFALMGVGISVMGPIGLGIAGRLARPEARARAVARAATVGFAGFLMAPALMGGLAGLAGLRAAFLFIGLMVLAALLPLAALGRVAGALRPSGR